MSILGAILKLSLLGGGISSIVLPSLMAAGYKDYDGYGKQTRKHPTETSKEWKRVEKNNQSLLETSSTTKIGANATEFGKNYGISIGRIPGKTKISGKLDSVCKRSGSGSVTLGKDKWSIGKTNGHSNKKLYREVEFTCQDQSKHTLYLKGDGEKSTQRGGLGRVK